VTFTGPHECVAAGGSNVRVQENLIDIQWFYCLNIDARKRVELQRSNQRGVAVNYLTYLSIMLVSSILCVNPVTDDEAVRSSNIKEEFIGIRFFIDDIEIGSAYGSESTPIKFGLKGKSVTISPIIRDRKKKIVQLIILEDTNGQTKKILERTKISPSVPGKITKLHDRIIIVKLIDITSAPECSRPR